MPGIGLEHDRGDRCRALEPDHVVEVLQRPLAHSCSSVLGVERRAVEVRPEEVHDTAVAVVVGPAPRVAGQVDRRVGAAVVAAVAREHLVAPGVQPGHPDGVLDGVGAAVGEEDLVQVAGCALGDQPGGLGARVVGVLRRDRAQPGGLLLDRGDDLRVLVADVGVDQL